MLKLVGKTALDVIPSTDLSRLPDATYDFERDLVALDACVSTAGRYFVLSGHEDQSLPGRLRTLMRSVKHQFCAPSYDERYTCSEDRDTGSILVFRNVGKHADLEFFLYRRGSDMEIGDRIDASTFSIVLAGECTLNLHKRDEIESLDLVEGDIYVFDQRIIHSVTHASGTCVHLTTSIPRSVAKGLKQIGVITTTAVEATDEFIRSQA